MDFTNGKEISLGNLDLLSDYLSNIDYYEKKDSENNNKQKIEQEYETTDTELEIDIKKKPIKPKVTKESALNRFSLLKENITDIKDEILTNSDNIIKQDNDFDFSFDNVEEQEENELNTYKKEELTEEEIAGSSLMVFNQIKQMQESLDLEKEQEETPMEEQTSLTFDDDDEYFETDNEDNEDIDEDDEYFGTDNEDIDEDDEYFGTDNEDDEYFETDSEDEQQENEEQLDTEEQLKNKIFNLDLDDYDDEDEDETSEQQLLDKISNLDFEDYDDEDDEFNDNEEEQESKNKQNNVQQEQPQTLGQQLQDKISNLNFEDYDDEDEEFDDSTEQSKEEQQQELENSPEFNDNNEYSEDDEDDEETAEDFIQQLIQRSKEKPNNTSLEKESNNIENKAVIEQTHKDEELEKLQKQLALMEKQMHEILKQNTSQKTSNICEENKLFNKKENEQPDTVVNYDTYTAMSIDKLYETVKKFMLDTGVKKSTIELSELDKKFGANNIRKLIQKSYLIKIGKGVTIGR